MKTTRGIYVVAHGPSYVALAEAVGRYQAKLGDLGVPRFVDIEDDGAHGRLCRTSLNERSPWDYTLALDADVLVQSAQIATMFNCIPDNGLLLNEYAHWRGDEPDMLGVYAAAMRACNVMLPLSVYNGCAIGFGRGSAVDAFFTEWRGCWLATGGRRDMPALACAVKRSAVSVAVMLPGDLAVDVRDPAAILQHNWQGSPNLYHELGCEPPSKSSNYVRRGDFSWVNADEFRPSL